MLPDRHQPGRAFDQLGDADEFGQALDVERLADRPMQAVGGRFDDHGKRRCGLSEFGAREMGSEGHVAAAPTEEVVTVVDAVVGGARKRRRFGRDDPAKARPRARGHGFEASQGR